MAKVRRKIQESHCEEYLYRKDMYTTLLTSLTKPGSIVSKYTSISIIVHHLTLSLDNNFYNTNQAKAADKCMSLNLSLQYLQLI